MSWKARFDSGAFPVSPARACAPVLWPPPTQRKVSSEGHRGIVRGGSSEGYRPRDMIYRTRATCMMYRAAVKSECHVMHHTRPLRGACHVLFPALTKSSIPGESTACRATWALFTTRTHNVSLRTSGPGGGETCIRGKDSYLENWLHSIPLSCNCRHDHSAPLRSALGGTNARDSRAFATGVFSSPVKHSLVSFESKATHPPILRIIPHNLAADHLLPSLPPLLSSIRYIRSSHVTIHPRPGVHR